MLDELCMITKKKSDNLVSVHFLHVYVHRSRFRIFHQHHKATTAQTCICAYSIHILYVKHKICCINTDLSFRVFRNSTLIRGSVGCNETAEREQRVGIGVFFMYILFVMYVR